MARRGRCVGLIRPIPPLIASERRRRDKPLTTGPVMDPKALGPIPDNVTELPFVPQDEVLPHASLVLCHGGFGTLLEALARGIPVVVVPLFADQPANARSVERTGAGLAVWQIDSASIGTALQRIWTEPSFRAGAGRIAAEIKALATPEEAVERIYVRC